MTKKANFYEDINGWANDEIFMNWYKEVVSHDGYIRELKLSQQNKSNFCFVTGIRPPDIYMLWLKAIELKNTHQER